MIPFLFEDICPNFGFKFEGNFSATGFTAIFGPSGSGKTTLLRCFAGLHKAKKGELRINNVTWQSSDIFLPTHRRSLSFIFQEDGLLPHLNVRKNLEFALKRSTKALSQDFNKNIERFGIEHLLQRKVHLLSGGERQRVCLARALSTNPELILMDEPMSSLDEEGREELLPYLHELATNGQTPVLYISHSSQEVQILAKQIIFVSKSAVIECLDVETAIRQKKFRSGLKFFNNHSITEMDNK